MAGVARPDAAGGTAWLAGRPVGRGGTAARAAPARRGVEAKAVRTVAGQGEGAPVAEVRAAPFE